MKTILIGLLLIPSSFAASPRTVAVNLPPMHGMTTSSASAKRSPTRIEVLASSWQPTSLAFMSRARETGSFRTGALPKLSLTAVPLLAQTGYGRISGRLGAGVLPMEREGKIDLGAATQTESQSLYLVPGNFGVQFEPAALQWNDLGFHLSASAVPTVAILGKSALGESETATGMGYELSAGGSYDLGGTELTTSLSQTFGKMRSADLRGLGIQAGVRVGL